MDNPVEFVNSNRDFRGGGLRGVERVWRPMRRNSWIGTSTFEATDTETDSSSLSSIQAEFIKRAENDD